MVSKMPDVAHEAMDQLYTSVRRNRRQYFYLDKVSEIFSYGVHFSSDDIFTVTVTIQRLVSVMNIDHLRLLVTFNLMFR